MKCPLPGSGYLYFLDPDTFISWDPDTFISWDPDENEMVSKHCLNGLKT